MFGAFGTKNLSNPMTAKGKGCQRGRLLLISQQSDFAFLRPDTCNLRPVT